MILHCKTCGNWQVTDFGGNTPDVVSDKFCANSEGHGRGIMEQVPQWCVDHEISVQMLKAKE